MMMDNNGYFEQIASRIDQLKKLRIKSVSFSSAIIGSTLFREDILFCATIDRSIQLLDGFILLLEQRNLTCVGAILRLQMDNCMRTYAPFIAQDKNAVIDCIIYGGKIKDQKDIHGKKMSDAYLKEQLKTFDDSFSHVYDQVSGYVHFSDRAFYQTVIDCDDEGLKWQIGTPLLERHNSVLIEAADLFIRFMKLHHQLLQPVAESKMRFESSQEIE